MKKISRAEALSQGLKRYFTGKPCKRGHVTLRLVSGYACCECKDAYTYQYYRDNKEQHLKACRSWADRNLEARKVYLKLWKRENSGKNASYCAKRRAAKLKAIPPWADLEKIKVFYQECPDGYHVDHIVPLQHPLVCGLHVSENLQYLTAEENLKKGNQFTS